MPVLNSTKIDLTVSTTHTTDKVQYQHNTTEDEEWTNIGRQTIDLTNTTNTTRQAE